VRATLEDALRFGSGVDEMVWNMRA
jgi:hypothetical protein